MITKTTLRKAGPALSLVCALFTGGCAAGGTTTAGDPIEGFNRKVFTFNDALDRHFAEPVARGYQRVTPQPVRTAVRNFFSNLGDFPNAVNNLLQGKIAAGVEDVMRIAINTLFGVGGLIDVATQARLPKHNQDFGLTLGTWGVATGPYLVLPLFGPSDFRDAPGKVVDLALDPTTYIDAGARDVLFGVNFVSARASYLGATDLLTRAALDKYSFVRDAYLQRRASLLSDSRQSSSGDGLPDYGDAAAPAAALGTTPAPVGATPAPVDATSAPVGTTPAPVDPASAPVDGTPAPTSDDTAPVGNR